MIPALIGRVLGFSWLSKHALLTALFPNLVFVALVTLVAWPSSSPTTPANVGALGAFLFVAGVVAMAYFTLNVQPTLLRLYQGDFAPDGWLGGVTTFGRRRWRNVIGRKKARDSVFEDLQVLLYDVENAVETIRKIPIPDQSPELAKAKLEIAPALTLLATALSAVRPDMPIKPKQVAAVTAQVDALGKIRERYPAANEKPNLGTLDDVRTLIATVGKIRDDLYANVDAEREWLRHTTVPYLPRDASRAGPTRLSNVFYSAEEDLESRYGIRPWLLTSHLRMVLPAGYAESLLDEAKLGLDLALTLSAMFVVYGFVLSLLIALAWPDPTLLGIAQNVWPGFGAIAVAAATAILVGMLLRAVNITERAGLGKWVAIGFPSVLIGVIVYFTTSPSAAWEKGALFISGFALACGIAGAIYLNGVMAAIVYCNGIKTLFDAHRAKILSALRLRIPSNLADERILWRDVCAHIARSTPPDPRYFVFTGDATVQLPRIEDARGATKVLAAARPIRAFEKIATKDVINITQYTRDQEQYYEDADPSTLNDATILCDIAYGKPIPKSAIASATSDLANRAACTLRIARSILPPGLHVGAKITLIYGAARRGQRDNTFYDVIVTDIDVDTWSDAPAADANGAHKESVPYSRIGLALPADDITALAHWVASGTAPLITMVPA